MYIETVPNRGSRPTILLREGRREGKRVIKRTLANLTSWPPHKIDALRRALNGELSGPDDIAIEKSTPHGHVRAVLEFMKKLGVEKLLATKPCRERELITALIAQRILDPCSKLATTRQWHSTTYAEDLGIQDADADELYVAMDWLLERQGLIEKKIGEEAPRRRCCRAVRRIEFVVSRQDLPLGLPRVQS